MYDTKVTCFSCDYPCISLQITECIAPEAVGAKESENSAAELERVTRKVAELQKKKKVELQGYQEEGVVYMYRHVCAGGLGIR